MWGRIIWYMLPSLERLLRLFTRNSTFLRSGSTRIPNYTASYHRSPSFQGSSPWERQFTCMPISSKLLRENKQTLTHTKIQYDAMNPRFLKEESRLGMLKLCMQLARRQFIQSSDCTLKTSELTFCKTQKRNWNADWEIMSCLRTGVLKKRVSYRSAEGCQKVSLSYCCALKLWVSVGTRRWERWRKCLDRRRVNNTTTETVTR